MEERVEIDKIVVEVGNHSTIPKSLWRLIFLLVNVPEISTVARLSKFINRVLDEDFWFFYYHCQFNCATKRVTHPISWKETFRAEYTLFRFRVALKHKNMEVSDNEKKYEVNFTPSNWIDWNVARSDKPFLPNSN